MVTARRGAIKLGCLLNLLIISAVLYFGVNAGEKYMAYLRYKDAMAHELRFRAKLPDHQLRNRFKTIADSLGLPADAGIVTITRKAGQITVESHYEEMIDLPLYKKEVHFEPRATGTYY